VSGSDWWTGEFLSSSPVLVLGATSPIARAIAREYASSGHSIFVAARNGDEASRIAADLRTRFQVETASASFDARNFAGHQALVDGAVERMGGFDVAVIAIGELGVQAEAQQDFEKALSIIEVNYTGAVSLCERIARHMEERKSGCIVGISSPAGDRGRKRNYFYGSAKGGFSLYLQGLRGRLAPSNVHVLTVKPGYIDTAMTRGMQTRIPIASPESVAQAIVKAQRQRKDTLYFPWFWRPVMFLVKAIPERMFKRLNI